MTIEGDLLKIAQHDFVYSSVNDEEIVETIRKFHQQNGYVLDPHTAVGVCAAEKIKIRTPVICLACAHPAKFGETIRKAMANVPELPDELAVLENLATHCKTVPADPEKIKEVILETLEA